MTHQEIQERNEKRAMKVKELSADFTPCQIARKLGLNYTQVTNIQIDPKNGIENPKRSRAYNVFRRDRSKAGEGFYDADRMPAYNF